MTELLAPAGNMEALRAAVSNGCDAVYLGLEKFGARAYSDNFTIDSLAEAIRYAHLRDEALRRAASLADSLLLQPEDKNRG